MVKAYRELFVQNFAKGFCKLFVTVAEIVTLFFFERREFLNGVLVLIHHVADLSVARLSISAAESC